MAPKDHFEMPASENGKKRKVGISKFQLLFVTGLIFTWNMGVLDVKSN